MRIYFDTEFTGLHQNTTLISIGLIAEDGQELYCELTDYDKSQVDDWIKENVIAHLLPIDYKISQGNVIKWVGDKKTTREVVTNWLLQFDDVQMISDCPSYDWVLFCQLWGHAFKIPRNVSPAPRDINQDIADYLGISEKEAFDLSRERFLEWPDSDQKHNALWDARVIKACYEKIQGMAG